MLLKKSFFIFLYSALLGTFVSANDCSKWFPMPAMDGLVVVMPIYDESITGADLDCDEILDAVDTDIDGDGVRNSNDAFPVNPSETIDTDGDGVGNNADLDDDGDGDSDMAETAAGSDSLDASSTLDDTHFIITVKTDHSGTSSDTEFTIPPYPIGDYNYNVDCNNDGVDEVIGATGEYTCVYTNVGTYTVVIKDNTGIREGFTGIYFNKSGDNKKIIGINQWGTAKWASMNRAFYGCSNLNGAGVSATDKPNLSRVKNMSSMFQLTGFNQNIGNWDISTVEDMSHMFHDAFHFNQDIGDWNTSHVINMNYMFKAASAFNQDITGWDTANVREMHWMLFEASSFSNNDLSTWNVDNVLYHKSFMWNTGTGNTEPAWPHFIITVKTDNIGITDDNQFYISTYPGETYNYNVDCNNDGINENRSPVVADYSCDYNIPGTYTISIKDNLGDGTGFPRIYFNNNDDKDKIVGINQWGTGKWTSMEEAFYGCSNLNDEGGAATDSPNLSGVTNMSVMFADADAFNQDIGDWNTSSVTSMKGMFHDAHAFNQDISNWDTGTVRRMEYMFNFASAFTNQNLSSWNIGNVVDHTNFMTEAGINNIEPIW